MKHIKSTWITITALALGSFLPIGAVVGGPFKSDTSSVGAAGAVAADSRARDQAQAQPQVEQQRKEAETKGQKTIDKDAVSAIEEAQRAVKAIADGKNDQAIAAIERATGKINILLARKPSTAMLPVDTAVEIVDPAPKDPDAIRALSAEAEKALGNKNYPKARTLLDQLASEIRIRTYLLPLASYPAAMQEAARLLDQKKAEDAKQVLLTALNTLQVVDAPIPIPVALAKAAVANAQAQRDKNKAAAQSQLAMAKANIERAKNLGYDIKDSEYTAINQSIANLDKQLNGTQDTTSAFEKLKEKISNLFRS